MSPNKDQESNDTYDDDNHEEFEEMLKRWGVNLPEEKAKAESLGIDQLLVKWCKGKYKQPGDAIKALKEGRNHIEAAACLFGYCYSYLVLPDFGMTIEKCLEEYIEMVKAYRDALDDDPHPEIVQLQIEISQNVANICHDLISFKNDFLAEQILYPEDRDNRYLKSYVDVLLAATRAILILSGEKINVHDLYLNEILENTYAIVKQGGVKEAENFSASEFHNDGQSLSGDVLGFMACLGCAVVCLLHAQTISKLEPEYNRNYEIAFKAYIQGAKYLLKTPYDSSFFNDLLNRAESFENKVESNKEEAYWNTIEVWEQVKKSPEKVKDWRELRGWLLELEDIMYKEAHDADIGPDPIAKSGSVYLGEQISFCEGNLNQKELFQFYEDKIRNQHKNRLQNDFFEGLWQYLEDQTKICLIDSEHEWYDNQTIGSHLGCFVKYSKAFETELHAIIFHNDEVQKSIRELLRRSKDKNDKWYKLLHSQDTNSLYLSDMRILLTRVREYRINKEGSEFIPIEKAIANLPIPEDIEKKREYKIFLCKQTFTDDLRDIYQIRNSSIHRLRDSAVLSHMNDLRQRILGIGNEGYLRKLAEIKKYIPRSNLTLGINNDKI